MFFQNPAKCTCVCISCQMSYRRSPGYTVFACPSCGKACEVLRWSDAMPSPKRKKQWSAFVRPYLNRPTTQEYYRKILDATFNTPGKLSRGRH